MWSRRKLQNVSCESVTQCMDKKMAAVAFSLSDAEEYSPVEVVEDYYFVLLLSLHCDFALKYLL